MRIKLPERLAALFLSLVMVLSCSVPYGFAAETDGAEKAVVSVTVPEETDAQPAEAPETDDADTVTVAAPVEAPEADDAEAVTVAAPVEAPETDDAEAVTDAAPVEAPEADDADTVTVAAPVEAPETDDAESVGFATLSAEQTLTGLTDFSSFNHAEDDLLKIDTDAKKVTLNFTPGDHFVVYNGLDHKV
ncbi:MAG: hypothetical protein IKO14_04605, partial [Oscillibacter sp.]|nr:hypothetical protein [Oscillibacter sp.]